MKINKKNIITILLIGFLSYLTYDNIKINNSKSHEKLRKTISLDLMYLNKIFETVDKINKEWVGEKELKKEELYEAAIKGIVKSLDDPYSEYLTKKELTMFNEDIDRSYVGVGISIKKEKGNYLEVISPFIGSPAFKAGIQIGDIMTKINDIDIIDLDSLETSKMLRGDENTTVKVEIVRKGIKEPLFFVLKREKIKLENIESKMIDEENKIGYISLLNFGSESGKEIKEALIKLINDGMKKLILDLRTNPGGSVSEAVEISSFFVKEDLIVTLNAKYQKKEYTRKGDVIFNGDMVVLVNKGSASASEIVTGVLKDYKRATIIGEKTFGKGVAQKVSNYRNAEDALKLTIAQYSTPKNNNINKNGIKPDIYVKMNSLLSEKGYSFETDLAKENRKKEIEKILVEIEGKEKAKQILEKGDIQLKTAINFLLGKPYESDKYEESEKKETKKDKILKENNKK